MTTEHERNGALEAVDRIVNRGGEAEDVLRETLAALGRLYPYVAIRITDECGLAHGTEEPAERYPIEFQGTKVAELEVAAIGPDDGVFLSRVATLISGHCRPRKMRSTFRGS